MEVIFTENLTKHYGKIQALQDLNLKVEKGHCVGFLGPNGAGKSTTIKILCGLIRPTKGKAYINGYDVIKETTKVLKDVGAIVETPEFYPYLTPKEILSYLGKIRGIPDHELEERIRHVLQMVKLSEWMNTKIGKFSRGMKQRLGLAQAILHEPTTLILDEPALGLDPRGTYEIREIIKEMVKEGKTVFLASHMLREVQELCDSVALINKGILLAYDTIDNLEEIFKTRKVQVKLLKPLKNREVKKIGKINGVHQVSVNGQNLTISFEGDEAEQAEILNALVKNLNLQVVSFSPSLEALEDLYLKLIKEGN